MAEQPQIPGPGDTSSHRAEAAPRVSEGIFAPAASNSIAVTEGQAKDSGGELLPMGSGLERIGQEVGEFGNQQAEAQKAAWLVKTGSQYDLQAQSIFQNAQRNAQPGQNIGPQVGDALNTLHENSTKGVQNPLLQAQLDARLSSTKDAVMKAAAEYDFKARDDYTTYNLKQGVNNNTNVFNNLMNKNDIEDKLSHGIGEFNTAVADSHLPVDQVLKLQEFARLNYTDAANERLRRVMGPEAYLNQNVPRTPSQGMVSWIMQHEGGYVAQDGSSGAPAIYGINAKWHPDEYAAAKQLTDEKGEQAGQKYASDFYQKNYVDKVQGLPGPSQLIVADAMVNQGNYGNKLAQAARDGANPQDLIDMRTEEYKRLARENPDKYGANLDGWMNRMSDLSRDANNFQPGESTEGNGYNPTIAGSLSFRLGTAEQRLKWIGEAYTEMRQQRMEAQYTGQVAEAGLNNIQRAAENGFPIDDNLMKQTQSAINNIQVPSMAQRQQQVLENAKFAQTLWQMPVAGASQAVKDVQMQPQTPETVAKLNFGERVLKNMETQIKSDPVMVAERNPSLQLPPVKLTDPATLKQYAARADVIGQRYGTDYSKSLFNKDQQGAIVDAVTNADTNTKGLMLKSWGTAFGARSADAAAMFKEKLPEFAYAAGLVGSTGDMKTGTEILNGAARIKDDKDNTIRLKVIDQHLNLNNYAAAIGSPQVYDQVKTAARAIYANRYNSAFTTDGSGDVDKAITDALGGARPLYFNGRYLLTPPGVDSNVFERSIKNLDNNGIKSAMENAALALGNSGPVNVQLPRGKGGATWDASDTPLRMTTVGPGLYMAVDDKGQPIAAKGMPGGKMFLKFGGV